MDTVLRESPVNVGPKEPKKIYEILVIGDSQCGKTQLIRRLCHLPDNGTENTACNIFAEYRRHWEPLNSTVMFRDLPGDGGFDRMRPLVYLSADAVMCTFNVSSPLSWDSVADRWLPELHQYCEGKPLLLVGLQSDLRTSARGCVPMEVCYLRATEAGLRYYECSAWRDRDLDFLLKVLMREGDVAGPHLGFGSSENTELFSKKVDDCHLERGKFGRNDLKKVQLERDGVKTRGKSVNSSVWMSLRSPLTPKSTIKCSSTISTKSSAAIPSSTTFTGSARCSASTRSRHTRPSSSKRLSEPELLARSAILSSEEGFCSVRSSFARPETASYRPRTRQITRMNSMTTLREPPKSRCALM